MSPMVAKSPCDAGVVLSGPESIACSPRMGRWVLAATILGSSMAFIDGSAVNVALPVLQVGLGASVTQVQWIIESYALFLAALILVGGSLGDRLGRRRVFMWGVGGFALASLWCGVAPDANQLIIARGVQGAFAALVVPGSLAIISASFEGPSRGKAIGTWSGFTAITMAAGPVIGGWLATSFSWRWVFFLNLPLAAAVLAIAAAKLSETRDESAEVGVDWAGAALSVVGLGLLVYGLIESANLGLGSPIVLLSVAGGVVALVGFVWVEGRSTAPMMPLGIFRSRMFTGANLLTLLLYGALGGVLFFVPFNMIQVQGYTPAQAGVAWLPFIFTIAVFSRWTGALVTWVGPKVPLVVGPLIAALGFALGVRPGVEAGYWAGFFPSFLVIGLGMAVAIPPLVTVVLNSVDPRRSGIASGVNNAVSRAAGLVAIAVMGVVVLTTFNGALDDRLAELGTPQGVVASLDEERINLAAARLPEGLDPDEVRNLERAIKESFVAGFRVAMGVGAALAAAGALVAALFIQGRQREPAAGVV